MGLKAERKLMLTVTAYHAKRSTQSHGNNCPVNHLNRRMKRPKRYALKYDGFIVRELERF